MKRMISLVFILVGVACVISAQNHNFINVVVPQGDTLTTPALNQRLNACTLPGSEVRINGDPCKVYPNGVFAGFVPLKPGINQLTIKFVSNGI